MARTGFARRLITAALQRERAGPAAFALLYGIGDFYHRFGYATLGAGFGLALRHPERGDALPDGWRVRPAREADLPAIQRLYHSDAATGVMRPVRPPDDPVWTALQALLHAQPTPATATTTATTGDACRVVQHPRQNVVAYAWLGRGCWTVDHAQERYWPDDLFIGEVVAGSPRAADAVLAACRLWALEETARRGRRVATVRVGAAPDDLVAAAGQYQEVELVRTLWAPAGPQVRTLSTLRLLTQIRAELSRRVSSLRTPWTGTVTIRTEEGDATLHVAAGAVRVTAPNQPTPQSDSQPNAQPDTLAIRLPQQTLIRLVLGAFPPGDLLARTTPRPTSEARACLLTLFPQRLPYMYPWIASPPPSPAHLLDAPHSPTCSPREGLQAI